MEQKIKTMAILDFTSDRKCMSTIVTGYKNEKDTLMKGAPDRILAKCTAYLSVDSETPNTLSNNDREAILKQVEDLSSQGLRCIGVAEIPNCGRLSDINEANKNEKLSNIKQYNEFEQDAVFLGVVGIKDPVRQEVKPAIEDCKTAGIRVIMITGDSKFTAMSIAKELGIITSADDISQCVFTGDEFEKMNKQ